MKDKILDVRGITKNYSLGKRKIPVLRGIDFRMNSGDFVSIQGISGVGKSTFLNLIGAMDVPNSGEIFVGGKNLETWRNQNSLHLYRREKIGFIFQYHYLIPDFTVLENVCAPLLIKGLRKKHIYDKTLSLLDEIGLSKRKDHFPHQISGGESQRTSMARAMIHEPGLILADEPTGNLDLSNTLKFIELLQKMQQKRELSILVATHENELASSAKKRYQMIDGRIES